VFEVIILGGTRETPLALQTRLGKDIPNSPALPDGDPTEWAALLQKYKVGPEQIRTGACGVYNCAGHVWASRRTAIYEAAAYTMILGEDGYRTLDSGEMPRLGDLAVYLARMPSGATYIFHVGVVAKFEKGPAIINQQAEQSIPWVLSKLNDWGGELFHHCSTLPAVPFPFELEYWTDREHP
jgi:hypothetical protein